MPIDFAATKSRFHLPEGIVYLDGNSLGPMVKTAPARMEQAMQSEWAEMLIRGWNKAGWMAQPAVLGDRIGKLIGAPPAPWSWATRCRSRSTRPLPRRWR
jgi:kynureninase